MERLALISLGRLAGFSLDEIALMFAPDGRPRIDRQMLVAKADELDRRIRNLTVMRDGLRHAAACPAPTHMDCPKFRRLVGTAMSGAFVPRGKGVQTPVTCQSSLLSRDNRGSDPLSQPAFNLCVRCGRAV